MSLTQQRLKQVLHYDPTTGVFTAVVARGKLKVGQIAGSLNSAGYVQFYIDNKNYYGHRLAWLYVHGVWPSRDLDHEDTKKSHNWLSNLRLCTQSQNNANEKLSKNNTSGNKGVVFDRARGRWMAQIKVARKTVHLGRFKTKGEAATAYITAARRHFGPFARAA